MEIFNRLSVLLSPTFFGTLAGLSLAAATMLFGAGKRSSRNSRRQANRLSELEPQEYRGAGYLILSFGWSMFGLLFVFVFSAIGYGLLRNVVITLSFVWLFFALCFFYAGAGELLRALTGKKGGVVRRFFPPMRYIDVAIITFGDFLSSGVFRR